MKQLYKTLIIDDHGVVVCGIKGTLKEITESMGSTFEIHVAYKCSQALSILKSEPCIDLVFLDIKLPKEPEIGMFSGEDLGIGIRKLYPKILIIVMTAYDQPIVINRIIDEFAPEGFFVKGDIEPGKFAFAISRALIEPPYYSSTVKDAISKQSSKSVILENLDIQLLYELDRGLTLEEIGEIISLSSSGVAKRKSKLKVKLGVPDGRDRDLINRARELCFI